MTFDDLFFLIPVHNLRNAENENLGHKADETENSRTSLQLLGILKMCLSGTKIIGTKYKFYHKNHWNTSLKQYIPKTCSELLLASTIFKDVSSTSRTYKGTELLRPNSSIFRISHACHEPWKKQLPNLILLIVKTRQLWHHWLCKEGHVARKKNLCHSFPKFSISKQRTKISLMRDWRSTPLEWLSSNRDLDLDVGSGHTAYRLASVIDLYLQTKYHWNWENFFVDVLTTGTPPSSRSCDSKTKTNIKNPAQSYLDIEL